MLLYCYVPLVAVLMVYCDVLIYATVLLVICHVLLYVIV